MPPHVEIAAPADLQADCEAVSRRLRLAADRAVRPAPGLRVDERPRESAKRGIEISEAAQHLANALHLHLD